MLRISSPFFSREASMKSEKREKKNENRKMKTPVYDGEGWTLEVSYFRFPPGPGNPPGQGKRSNKN